MALERKILKITNATIQLDQMEAMDTEDTNAPLQSNDRKNRQAGSLYPLAQINKYKFSENELVRMSINEDGFLPEISLTVVSSDGVFLSKSYPKDGDPLSIFIRSKMDEFNPIRMDFDITNVSSSLSTDSSGEVSRFTFTGTLRVPGLHADHCKVFKDKTSFDALNDVASELKLGYASNDTSTNDKMNWICPFDTYLRFIGDVTRASYKDDDSFFRTFVDKYYNLNFVNVNSQFGEDFELEEAIGDFSAQRDYFTGHNTEKYDTKLMLCNHPNLRGTGNWISQYSLVSDAGEVVIQNGYRRYAQFYDAFFNTTTPKEKYQSHFVEPLNTQNAGDDKILMRGRLKEPEIFQNTNKYKWLGIQMTNPKGNAHENYLYALIQNWQNEREIDKFSLRIMLTKCNFNIYRGMRIPVLILNIGSQLRNQTSKQTEQSESEKLSYDKFLSGYYYVKDMRISWSASDAVFRQELVLTRREWPIPPQTEQNIAQG